MLASQFIAAIDQGTTSTRCILFNRQGNIVSSQQKEHRQIYPQPGWVEHDPDEIWKNTQEVIVLARIKGNVQMNDIVAVGITNQRETTVVWNRLTGKPYYNALVWQDTRTGQLLNRYAQTDEAGKRGQDRFWDRTGLPLATYFSSLKLRWILDHVPDVRADAEAGVALFGTMDTFVIWHLTGGVQQGRHVTDVTNASRTQLMNLETLAWDDTLLETFGIPRSMLPQIRSSSEEYGRCKSGVLSGVPIAGILGDQQAALVGQTCFEPGQAKNTYGTGCFLLMNTGPEICHSTCGLLTTVAYQFGKQPVHYALEGSVAIAGALMQWLRDNMGLVRSSAEVEMLAQTVTDNGGAYFVPAFSGLYAPYWRQVARGVIVGLTRYVQKGHLAQAALEATAYQTIDVVQAMEQNAGINLNSLRVDGGMSLNALLMQFQADTLGVPVVRPSITETTALGAAYAAGLAIGFWKDLADLRQNWAVGQTFMPQMPNSQKEQLYNRWQKAVERSLGWEE